MKNLSKELQDKVLLKEEITRDDEKVKITVYKNCNYLIRKIYDKRLDYTRYESHKDGSYIPYIYIKDDLDGNGIESIDIETASYGSMNIEEVSLVIEGYQIAVETVKQLQKIFNVTISRL